ncbi:10719_t:CDS:10 [Ambispora gerdemannii]|uniref:10719_t:CDS:1 n=1 Tax=Ambispora gerdemannii TaxID=144530 RepID=A0A9N8YMQ1_9GLOM|nr:10719_t:CDS:10 [Ambispora gerdemannii]
MHENSQNIRENIQNDNNESESEIQLEQETTFIVAAYLEQHPALHTAFKEVQRVLDENPELLPRRIDFTGQEHVQKYEEVKRKHQGYGADYLRRVMRAQLVNKSNNASGSHSSNSLFQGIPNEKISLSLPDQIPTTKTPLKDNTLVSTFESRELGGSYSRSRFSGSICHEFEEGGDDFLVKVWCTNTAALIATLTGHDDAISDMSLNKESTLLATSSNDCTLTVWDLKTYFPIYRFNANDMMTSIAFAPSPIPQLKYLLATSDDEMTYILPIDPDNKFSEPLCFQARSTVGINKIKCHAFNSTGSLFAIGGTDGLVRVFSSIDGRNFISDLYDPTIFRLDVDVCHRYFDICDEYDKIPSDDEDEPSNKKKKVISKKGKAPEGNVDVDNDMMDIIMNGTEIELDEYKNEITVNQMAPEDYNSEAEIISGTSTSNSIKAFPSSSTNLIEKLQTDSLLSKLKGKEKEHDPEEKNKTKKENVTIKSKGKGKQREDDLTANNPDGDEPSADAPIRRPTHLADLDGHIKPVLSLAFSHQGNRILSGSTDGTARIWDYDYDVKEWKSIILSVNRNDPDGVRDEVTTAVWTPDDRRVIVGSSYGHIFIFDSRDGSIIYTFRDHKKDVFVLEIHPMFKNVLLSAGYDGLICFWDIIKGSKIREFKYSVEDDNDDEEDPNDPVAKEERNKKYVFVDGKFNQDGTMFMVAEERGFVKYFTVGDARKLDIIAERFPKGQGFMTDSYNIFEYGFPALEIDPITKIPHHLKNRGPVIAPGYGFAYDRQLASDYGLKWPIGVSPTILRKQEKHLRHTWRRELKRWVTSGFKMYILPKTRLYQRRSKYPSVVIEIEPDDDPLTMDEPIHPLPLEDAENYEPSDYTPSTEDDEDEYAESDLDAELNNMVSNGRPQRHTDYYDIEDDETQFSKRTKTRSATTRYNTRHASSSQAESSHPTTINSRKRKAAESDFDFDFDYEGTEVTTRSGRRSTRRRVQINYRENDYTDFESDASEASYKPTIKKNVRHRKKSSYARKTKTRNRVIASSSRTSSSSKRNIFTPDEFESFEDEYDTEKFEQAEEAEDLVVEDFIGDIVVYFRQGHGQYYSHILTNFGETPFGQHLGSEQAMKLLPWNKDASLVDVLYARVKSMEWHVGPPTWLTIKLELLQALNATPEDPAPTTPDWKRKTKGTQVLTIEYYEIPDFPDFIVPYSVYIGGQAQHLGVQEQVFIRNKDVSGIIVEISEAGPGSWQAFKVAHDSEDGMTTEEWLMSAWELRSPNFETEYVIDSDLARDVADRLKQTITGYIINSSYYDFVDHVNTQLYPMYLTIVAYPMCLNMILKRLQNGFYRHIEAVREDVKLILTNAMTFNEPRSKIARVALEINLKMSEMISLPSWIQQDENIRPFCEKYPNEAATLLQVYRDLKFVKSWTSLTIEDNETIGRCFIVGKKSSQESQTQIIIPCSSFEIWSVERLSHLLSCICPPDSSVSTSASSPSSSSFNESTASKSLILAINTPDSTVVYYSVNDGTSILSSPIVNQGEGGAQQQSEE